MNADMISKAVRTAIRGLALLVAMFGVTVDDGAAMQAADTIAAGVAAALWLIPEIIGWIKAMKAAKAMPK